MKLFYFSTLNRIAIIAVLLISLLSGSCSQNTAPSAKAQRPNLRDPYSGSFKASPRKGRKAPQMGFYQKRQRPSIFTSIKRSVNTVFSDKNKRHKLNNDRRSSSQSYANDRQKEQSKKINKGFAKGKRLKSNRKNKKSDRNSDSFSAPQKKKR